MGYIRGRARTPEQKKDILEIVQMRMDGYTLQEIADKYGVTRQCIQQKLASVASKFCPCPKGIDERIVYPNLAKWMNDNGIQKYKLAQTIGGSKNNTNTQNINKKLYGERDFSMSEIKKLLEITGQTFEFLFAEKAVDCEAE